MECLRFKWLAFVAAAVSHFLWTTVALYPQTSLPRRVKHFLQSHGKVDIFHNWIYTQGCKKEDSRISFEEKNGALSAIASSLIQKNEVFCALSTKLSVTSSEASKQISSVINPLVLRTKHIGALALFLLLEKQRGDASKYAPYINTLPTHAPGIIAWTVAELNLLRLSTTRNIQSVLDAVDADVATLKGVQDDKLPPMQEREAAFRWAIGIIKSRSVVLDGQRMLLPGIDACGVDCLAENAPEFANSGLFGEKLVRISADRSYKVGDCVQMSFGLKSAAQCLEDHGFLPPARSSDFLCEIEVAMDKDADKFCSDKVNVLSDNGCSAMMRFDLVADPELYLDPDLLRFLRLKLLDGKDAYILEPCFANSIWQTLSQPFSKVNEKAVFSYLLDFCEMQLQNFATADSLSILDPNIRSDRIQKMKELRIQETSALETTREIAKYELQTLESPTDLREYYQERRLRELDLLRPLDEREIIPLD